MYVKKVLLTCIMMIHVHIIMYVTELCIISFYSRIGYYVSSFQSIFTAEGVFHREAAKVTVPKSAQAGIPSSSSYFSLSRQK